MHTGGRKNILIIITGGTICMRPAAQEGVEMRELSCSSMEEVFAGMAIFNDPSLPSYSLLEWRELLDSSDVTAAHWKLLAEQISENYALFDGFVILHGTDTLAFTASALSFIFEAGLNKTIVVTGAMLPITHLNTDASRNIAVSMLVAAHSQISDVLVVFGTRILKGNRVVKTNCTIMDPFDTPNHSHLGVIGIDITMKYRNWTRSMALALEADEDIPLGPPTLFTNLMAEHVCVLRVTPSFDPTILRQLAATEREPFGIVLQLYGTGTAPSQPRFIKAVQFAIQAGVTLVAVTQCTSGGCSLLTYANGVQLHEQGVIEGKDLTTEAAFVKLAYLFGKGFRGELLRARMERSLKGEMCQKVHKITGQATLHPIQVSPSHMVENNRHFKLSVGPDHSPNSAASTP